MKTLKKLMSVLIIAVMLVSLLVCASGCGITTRTAGKADGEAIPAGMYIYFLHSALWTLEQQYQYGELTSEYSSSVESSESSVESSESSVESSASSVESSASSVESSESSPADSSSTVSSSESSVDTNPATLWDAIIENKTAKEYVIEQAYRNCAWVITMEKKAVEYNIVLDAEDLQKLADDYESNGGKNEVEKNLNGMGISLSTYERIVKAGIIQDNIKDLLYGLDGQNPPDSAEMKTEYTENYRRVKHILFKTNELTEDKDDDGNVTKTVEQKKAEIEATYKSVLKRAQAGESFEDLATEYSDDSMDVEKGYVFAKDKMVKEFETAAWDLPVGQITTCESTYGWHIIKAYDQFEKDEYMTDAMSDYVTKYVDEKYNELEKEWLDAVVISRNSAAVRRYKPAGIHKDNSIAENVSAQIEYYNSYYSALLASQNS